MHDKTKDHRNNNCRCSLRERDVSIAERSTAYVETDSKTPNDPKHRRLLIVALVPCILTIGIWTASGDEIAKTPPTSDQSAVRVLVAYYSMRGTTEQMARAVAEGARAVPGTVVVVKKIEEVNKEDLQAADGIALGSPAYFANIAGTAKVAMDDWNWKLKVDFTDKVGGAFATGGGQTGGKEHVVVSLVLFMLNNRMVVAGPLYQDEEGDDQWGEIGATAMTGPLDPGVGESELDGARRLGERVARVARKMKGLP